MANDDLGRLLSLSGMTNEAMEPYKASSSLKVRMPKQKPNNPRFSDNSLEEAPLDKVRIGHTFRNFSTFCDHEEAVARTADEYGITGEEVERIARSVANTKELEFSEDFDDYNQVEPQEVAPKSIKDYLPSDFGSEREVQVKAKAFNVNVEWLDQEYNTHMGVYRVEAEGTAEARNKGIAQAQAEAQSKKMRFTLVDADALVEEKAPEVDEAYGYSDDPRKQRWIDQNFEATAALLPIEKMMVTVDQLGDNEYFGDGLMKGDTSIVCFAIETNSKPRLTFASTYGGVSDWKPGMKVLTYHDQTGVERPATVVTAFTGQEWSSPEGREAIKARMAKGGMDPKRKYSVRVFK